MSRVLVLGLAAASVSCAPVFDVDVGWTIDGEDPAASCAFLPDGAVVRVTADSREKHDERFGGEVKETSTDLGCDKGTGKVQVGNFSDVLVELIAKIGDDDVVFGTAAPFELNPGAVSDGYSVDDEPVVADIKLVQGTLHANLTVVGRACGDAGASSFTVDLFENSEPRSQVLVESGVTVDCEDNSADFVFSPVRVDAHYLVVATTTIGGETFSSSGDGEGISIENANTFSTVDLDLE